MGYHLVVTQDDHGSNQRHVELLRGSAGWGLTKGLLPGRLRGNRTILYVEYSADEERSRRRAAWLKTEEGRRVLQEALDADARGECACDELLAGPGPRDPAAP